MSRTLAPSRLSVKMADFIMRSSSAGLRIPRAIERESGSRYEGSPLLMSLVILLACTARSRPTRVTSSGMPYLRFMVEMILSSPGRCFWPLMRRMEESSWLTNTSSTSSEGSRSARLEPWLLRPRGMTNRDCKEGGGEGTCWDRPSEQIPAHSLSTDEEKIMILVAVSLYSHGHGMGTGQS